MLKALVREKPLKRLDVRTALAFITGPLLFALGAGLSLRPSGATSFTTGLLAIGSVLFTAGGGWQLQQAQQAVRHLPADASSWQWCVRRCALTSSLGTVLFNINTFFCWG